jgi:hypothetical protein
MSKDPMKDPKIEDMKKTKLDAEKAEQVKGGMTSVAPKKDKI